LSPPLEAARGIAGIDFFSPLIGVMANSNKVLRYEAANAAPIMGTVSGPDTPSRIGSTIAVAAAFSDADAGDTHTAVIDWGDGSTGEGTVTEAGGAGKVEASHVYGVAGVYPPTITVTDNRGGSATGTCRLVVIYDPEGAFVTGGGWINSPAGAYAADPSLTGKATFGFVSKHKKGATVPSGETQFQFQVADLSFHSSSYDWLVVAGAKAMYKGTGTVNGSGTYAFVLSAVDGALLGGGKLDTFCIKIWDKAMNAIFYDNQMEAAEDAEPATEIGGGSIVIRK
jgi:hypothetical protein